MSLDSMVKELVRKSRQKSDKSGDESKDISMGCEASMTLYVPFVLMSPLAGYSFTWTSDWHFGQAA